MKTFFHRQKEFIDVMNYIILLDLFFGGAGRLVMIGPISLRLLIFASALIYTIGYVVLVDSRLEGRFFALVFIFILYLTLNVALIGEKSISIKMDFYCRYLYVVLAFFYEIYFVKKKSEDSIEAMRHLIESMTLLFAIFSIMLWIYAFFLGGRAYSVIEMGFFRPKVYGRFDYIGGGIPRIFMNGSIFLPIGLLFQIDQVFNKPSPGRITKCFLYAIAIGTTFTGGLFLATIICTFVLLCEERVLSKRVGYFIIAILLFGLVITSKIGLLNIMLQRYSGDYSTSYRLIQLMSITNEFIKKPLFGHGFGHEFTTVYGNTVRTTSGFEVAWGELLVDCGLVGFVCFVAIIATCFFRLNKLSRYSQTTFLFMLSLILICIESFTNPFINNSIGLTFFAICAGMGNAYERGAIVSLVDG